MLQVVEETQALYGFVVLAALIFSTLVSDCINNFARCPESRESLLQYRAGTAGREQT